MPTYAHERRAHLRGKARVGRALAVRVSHGWQNAGPWTSTETRDIGVGGAFILGEAFAVGQQIMIELSLPAIQRVFRLKAAVRWVGVDKSGESNALGAGVQFTDIDVDVLLELNEAFDAM